MNEETRKRLAAWFDGESVDAAEMEAILEKDAQARAYIEELQRTREALTGAHTERTIPAPEWESVSARLDEIARKRATPARSPGVAPSGAMNTERDFLSESAARPPGVAPSGAMNTERDFLSEPAARSPGVAPSGAMEGARRFLSFPKALGAIAAVMVLGIAIWIPFRQASINKSTTRADLMVNSVEMVETDLEGVTPVVYLDQPSGWTVVWVLEDAEPAGI